jgi:hypothetical protein
LRRGQRDRIVIAQHPILRHHRRSRQQGRCQHEAVAGQRRPATPASGDQGDADQRHREADPRERASHGAVPHR